LNFLNAASSSKMPLFGCALGASRPPLRSPRQCIGPWLAMPRRLCVVIGPFMGWFGVSGKNGRNGTLNRLSGMGSGLPLGSPRSHARLSWPPKMWQLAQAESPS
jgi:hypothetical protein